MKTMVGIVFALVLSGFTLFGDQPQKKVKDQAEYNLFNDVTKQTDPAKQLQLLQSWKEKYPDSDFKEERGVTIAEDYAKLSQPAQAIKAAQEVLTMDPKNLNALVVIVNCAPNINPPTGDSLSAGEQAANTLVPNLDTFRPATVKDDSVWNSEKEQIALIAQTTLGWVKMQQKQFDAAESVFRKVLESNPKSGQVAYWLGRVEYEQKKFVPALYEFARAASYTGAGALPDAARQSADDFLKKAYVGYHGSDDGLDALKKQAATAALPPNDLKIASITEIATGQQQKEEEFLTAHPDVKLWRELRDALKADSGADYFDKSVKDALIPPPDGGFKQFNAKVVSMTNPKEIVVTVDDTDGPNGDATLVLASPVRGKLDPGAEISFAGVAQSYTKDPYSVKFSVEAKNVTGLPTRPPMRRKPAD